MNDQNLSSGGLSRKIGFALGGFVLISSLALATWMNAWNQRQSLESFQNLATNNAAFLAQMRLPKSPEMAQRLATVLDMGVGFKFADGENADWPDHLAPTIQELTSQYQASAKVVGNNDVATAPIGDSGTHLILIRTHEDPPGTLFNSMLIPALGLAFACGGVGLVLGRTIVHPLGILTHWLPNLDTQMDTTPQSISRKVTGRHDEIGKLAQALEQTATMLREEQQLRQQSERLATLGRIATSLAHEIKNPAAAIQMHADLLQQTTKDTEKTSVGLIREEVERITDLVNQWLFVAKSKPGKKQTHDLSEVLQSICNRLEPQFEHAKVKLQLELEKETFVEMDAVRVEQALRNPLINAAQAMPNGGTIRVQLSQEQEKAVLTIEDEGPGFTPEALKRFGEPFYSEKEGGMGIGLTLAKEVLEAHEGLIGAENKKESGARIICQLPLVKGKGQ